MLDRTQSTATSLRIVARGPFAASLSPEADPARLLGAPSREVETPEPFYSIRVADRPGVVCAVCGEHETGEGPVGYLGEDPICDLCLLKGSPVLGLLVAVACVTRSYGALEGGSVREQLAALRELGAFARIYEAVSAKTWVARMFQVLPSFSGPGGGPH